MSPFIDKKIEIPPMKSGAEVYFHPKYLTVDLPQETIDTCVRILSDVRAEIKRIEDHKEKIAKNPSR